MTNHMNDERFTIAIEDNGDWVRVYLNRGEPAGEVAKFLSRTLAGWIFEHPHLRVRFIVPISSNGDTSELHAWYEQRISPDTCQTAGD